MPRLAFVAVVKNLCAGEYAQTLIRSYELHPKLLGLRTPSDPQPVVIHPIGARRCAHPLETWSFPANQVRQVVGDGLFADAPTHLRFDPLADLIDVHSLDAFIECIHYHLSFPRIVIKNANIGKNQ